MRALPLLLAAGVVAGRPVHAQSPDPWRARVTRQWGTGEATRCVPDVAAAFARLPRHGQPLGFHLGSQPPLFRLNSHWQGVARLAVGDGRWLVASRSGSDSAIAVVHMASRASLPGAWGSNRLDGRGASRDVPPPPMDRVVQNQSAEPGIDHGGGIQAVGPYVVIPFEARGDSTSVVLYDFTDPAHPRRLGRVATEDDLPRLTQASLAALTRLDTGHWLLMVGGPSARRLTFLQGRDTVLADGEAPFRRVGLQEGGVEGGMQAINFVTQCDGALFAVGFENSALPPPSMGRDNVHLYQLVPAPDGPRLEQRGKLHIRCERCNLGGGAGVYVTPTGRMILYALGLTDAGPDDSVPLDEFASGEDD